MTLLVIYVLVALVFSFLCSIAEAVLLSVTTPLHRTVGATGPESLQLASQAEGTDQSAADGYPDA